MLPLALVALTACLTPEEYLDQADEQAYALIDSRRAQLFQEGSGFTIEPNQNSLRQRILRGDADVPTELTLQDLLIIAAENSREYQSAKESLYLAALDLTVEQWRLGNIPFAGASAGVDGVGSEAELASGGVSAGVQRTLGSGATILGNIGTSLFRVVSTGDGWDVISDLSLSITQPLLRGGGKAVTLEPLTQSERNLVYEARSFERFRRTFAVDVASQTYDLLLSMEQLVNQEKNYSNLTALAARNNAMADAGRMSRIEVDQAEQNQLNSENSLIVQRASLQRQFDQFKLFLGLPIEIEIDLDRGEFDRLAKEDEFLDNIDLTRAIEVAHDERLDFATRKDQLVDAERKIGVARNALLAGFDVQAGVGAASDTNGVSFDGSDAVWDASLSLDLPISRIPERNAYRRTLITANAARRSVERDGDQIKINVRDAVRVARNARASYELQVASVTLAQRRVDSTKLNLEAGRASTRDVLESEEALRQASNSRNSALISYTLARLDLYLELESLRVGEDGLEIDETLLERARTVEPEQQP